MRKHSDLLAQILIDHVCDGIILTDAEGRTVWLNPAFTTLSGYDLDDLVGKRPGDVLQGEETSAESRAELAAAIEAKRRCEVDIVNYSKSGRSYISEVKLSPIFDDLGNLTHFIAVQRDVTSERSLYQQSIDFSAYRRALEEQAIVSVADTKGRITHVNAKFCDISGYSEGELIGKTHRILNSGTHDRDFFHEMWRKIRAGATWHGEVCNRTKSGDLYWVDTTIVPVHGSDGEILRYVSTRYEITQRKKAELELKTAAEVDSLTGLFNRARMFKDLERLLRANDASQQSEDCLLIKIDLDHFKECNDTFGHHAGDLLLKEFARRLKQAAARDGSVFRQGGDEFAIIIPKDMTGAGTDQYLESIHQFLTEVAFIGETMYLPSCSMGAVEFSRDAATVEQIATNADSALYEAKRNGRNQWCRFNKTLEKHAAHRAFIKKAISYALSEDSFEIALQPISSVQPNEHSGFEALARLRYEGSFISPAEFIPLSEELGLVSQIGQSVRRKALCAMRDMKAWSLSPGVLAINVAAQEFAQLGFIDDLLDLLWENELSPEDLMIEITETALFGRSTESVSKKLVVLKEAGFQIALDDFGTGCSSLSHLKKFKVDKIKIDGSFVRNLESDQDDRALVGGVIALAKALGIQVVAECVETEWQRDFLRRCQCDFIQGYLYSKPLDVDAAAEFIRVRFSAQKLRA